MRKKGYQTIYACYVKRLLDLLGVIIILILFWWLFLLIGITILLDTGRPVIYSQIRCGRSKAPFKIYKFRTMVKNADKIGKLQTKKNDSRVTTTGKILRTTSLDELPQLFNILKGDMSFIGFRPDVFTGNEETSIKYYVRPGITGYAQVNGRSNITAKEKKKWEEKYVNELNFFLDLKIFLKTIVVVLKRENTN